MIHSHCELVKIAVEHPKGSTANVRGRLGVITKSETVSDKDTNLVETMYTVKDEYGQSWVYHDAELEAAVSEAEVRYCLKRIILKM